MSRRALAGRVGVSLGTVTDWESNDHAPLAPHLAALAEVLQVKPRDLAPLPPKPTMRELRQRAGLTQASLGRILNRNPGVVAAIEHGDWWPRDAAAWALAIGVDIETLRAAWEVSRKAHY